MRRLQLGLLVAAIGLVLAVPGPASAANHLHRCSGTHLKVFHADHMRSTGHCHVAHAVAKRLFRNWLNGNHSRRAGFTVAHRKWRCYTGGVGALAHVRCHSGAKKVRFRAYSVVE